LKPAKGEVGLPTFQIPEFGIPLNNNNRQRQRLAVESAAEAW